MSRKILSLSELDFSKVPMSPVKSSLSNDNGTLYKIEFDVDNGCSYTHDTALVIANSFEDAKEKLKKLINSIDSETYVSKIYKVDSFSGEVFTGKHGWR
jgi:hypothetical protein